MLGLAEYGDTPSPAPAAAEPDPGSQRSVLSIVDYKAEDPDDSNAVATRKQAAAALGVSLDEDSVKHVSQPGRVGGVGARFTTEIKRSVVVVVAVLKLQSHQQGLRLPRPDRQNSRYLTRRRAMPIRDF